MKAKTFSQFILENLNTEEVDNLLGWLHDAPYYPNMYSPLWASYFTDTRAQFEERLMQYPDLESRLQLDDIFIRQTGTVDERGWEVTAGWSQDPDEEEVNEADFPDSITRLALGEIRDDVELVAALDQMQQTILNKMAVDESLGEDQLAQVVELGNSSAVQRLCKNPATSAELLLKAVKKMPDVQWFAEVHPNWPEDITDWALGDW